MFPWIYGFEWTPGYLIFLGIFFLVVLTMTSVVTVAAVKSIVYYRTGRAEWMRWQSEFSELPGTSRACRHAFTGELPGRICDQGFHCAECAMHAKLSQANPPAPHGPRIVAGEEPVLGVRVPLDRFYHRGHTWVKPLRDGCLLVGLDELGRRLIGKDAYVKLPIPGTRLAEESTVCRAVKNGSEIRMLTPVAGEVVDAHATDGGWEMRLRPEANCELRHLLSGDEVRAWYRYEIQRLQLAGGEPDAAPALADGGELPADLSTAFPEDRWERVCGQMLLDV
jgi:glycine cleavage system H lipoate-binding protein